MTPFMLRVAEVVGSDTAEADVMPATRVSAPAGVGVGADRQGVIRSLAEQLVCEANAVLEDEMDHLALTDEIGEDRLAFTISYHGHSARVSTLFAGGHAFGQLLSDDAEWSEPHELAGPDALPDLIVRLLVDARAARHV